MACMEVKDNLCRFSSFLFICAFGSEMQFLGDIQHTVVCLKPVFNKKEA